MATSILTFEHAFYTGEYSQVVNTELESTGRVKQLQIRALLAQGQTSQALNLLQNETEPEFLALKAFATSTVADAEALLSGDNVSDATKHLVALTVASSGDFGKALTIAETSHENLDAGLLTVYLLLALNEISKAEQSVKHMRKWANDHVAFNIAEALVSLHEQDQAQKAFFIFEENNSMMPTAQSSLGEAVAQIKLRRFPEAELPLKEALKSESEASIFSGLALALIQGELVEASNLRAKLQLAKYTRSALVNDLKEKEDTFSRIVAKFDKVES